MKKLKITVAGTDIRCIPLGPVTTGMVGAVAEFTFDAAWDGLTKTAVFRAGNVARDVALLDGPEAEIPAEVLTKRTSLWVGVYGCNAAGSIVIPTVMANACQITAGADPSGDPGTKPDLPVWAQALAAIGDLEDLETKDKSSLVAAINEAAKTGGGGSGGADGKSAYEIAVELGFKGTEEEWLESLNGEPGVYILAEGETLEDAPAEADIVIDPNCEPEESPDSSQNLNPISKTEDMTQPVGVDKDGRLWTAPTADDGEEPADVLVGTLPYTVNENGLYMVSDSAATISTGEGGNQLLDFTAVTVEMIAGTSNSVVGEVLGPNTLKIGTNGEAKNAAAKILGIPVIAGATYTLFGRITNSVDIDTTKIITVRTINQDSTSQLNVAVTGDISTKSIIVDSDTETLDIQIIVQNNYMTSADAEITISLYMYQGELTEIPAGATFDVVAGKKYSLDAYLGMTLTTDTDGAAVSVYKTVAASSNDSVVFFGDSVFARSSVADEYTKRTGNPAMSCAVGGTRLTGSRDSTNEYYCYDMTQIADAIASGDFSAQVNGGMNTNFAVLASGSIANYNAFVLEFGTNDYPAGARFDGEDCTTVRGAITHILSTILGAYPNMRIVVMSTLRYITIGSGDESGVPVHEDGSVWEMNEVIKGVCEEYCVPFVDMYHKFGANGLTRNTLTSDGVHLMFPNGVKRYMDILAGQLNALGI